MRIDAPSTVDPEADTASLQEGDDLEDVDCFHTLEAIDRAMCRSVTLPSFSIHAVIRRSAQLASTQQEILTSAKAVEGSRTFAVQFRGCFIARPSRLRT